MTINKMLTLIITRYGFEAAVTIKFAQLIDDYEAGLITRIELSQEFLPLMVEDDD